ncbi:hypothetical protein H5410_012698 [Solanum commersonii]|uniref:Carotenoid cleavage dioxygenase 1 n=1 Tax=Solanum commersonii TaxID=4109 RepID=A0A9J6ASB6_SOLCO|nr:hypothetical protein H5410_012698 [Solanum commersonii]
MGMKEENAVARTEGGVVVVDPKPQNGVAAKAIDWVEWAIIKLMNNSTKPLPFFRAILHLLMKLPHLNTFPLKAIFRVGPNPKFAPVAGSHWFDGDGMIHGLQIKDGKATYVSRFVRTSRLKQEEFFGGAKFMKIGDLKGLFGLFSVCIYMLRQKLKVLDISYGSGTANTAMIYHHGKLLALHEGDKPYVVKVLEDGDLQTLGMMDYDKRGNVYFWLFADTATYRVTSKDGVMQDPVPITIPASVMMHDFAITENYAIMMDLPMYFRPKEMVINKQLVYSFDPTKKARFGVFPHYAKNKSLIKWFELPNCLIFHNANAWEEGDDVVLITSRLQNPDLDTINGTEKEEQRDGFTNELYEMRFNMKNGVASQKKLSEAAIDFPRINETYTGRKQRYVYGNILNNIYKITGIVKFDLHAEPETGKTKLEVGGNVPGICDLGPGRFGSEAVFVPREPGTECEEDDGYLILFVHDENTGKSSVNVIDAKTMSAEPAAVVELPKRVPYGFHAFFVTEEQIQEQAKM